MDFQLTEQNLPQLISASGAPVESRVTQLYRARTSYVVSCQHRPGRDSARAIVAGCRQVVQTLQPR